MMMIIIIIITMMMIIMMIIDRLFPLFSGYVLSVIATDQGANPAQNAATATLTVALGDVNDNDPVITGAYDVTKAEDTAVGSILFQIAATDADIGDNGR